MGMGQHPLGCQIYAVHVLELRSLFECIIIVSISFLFLVLGKVRD